MAVTNKTVEMTENYTVNLPDFQGPLDLLLTLIQDQALDITKISLARVTDEYLAYIEILKTINPTDLTDFLVIAARLVQIKSEVLLPKPPKLTRDSDEEDVGEALARQLLAYKQFKEVAQQLRQTETLGERNFVRTAPPPKLKPTQPETININLTMLLKSARRALAVTPPDPNVDDVVSREVVTIGQQMARIRDRLTTDNHLFFQQLLRPTYNKVEVIVTLLAVLELIKRQFVEVQQTTLFGEIVIHKNPEPPRLTEADWADLTGQMELS